MEATSSQEETLSHSLQKILHLHCISGVKHFKKILRSYVLFHLLFCALFFVQTVFLTSLYFLESRSLLFAVALFSLVLTFFTYLVMIFYFQAKKPEQLRLVKEWYLSICRKSVSSERIPEEETHLLLAEALRLFASYFQIKELPSYLRSIPLPSLQRLLKKCSFFWHWKDFQNMKELLLLDSIHEHLSLLKYEQTNLEVHASLGSSYLSLASVYKAMQRSFLFYDSPIFIEELDESTAKKFKNAVFKAIEEYKIIHQSTHQDPWVLAQLASCYHELQMYDKEIEYFEKILEISSAHTEVMLRLGYLYFQEGKNAQGFKIYQLIKESEPLKAEEIFDYYLAKAKQEISS